MYLSRCLGVVLVLFTLKFIFVVTLCVLSAWILMYFFGNGKLKIWLFLTQFLWPFLLESLLDTGGYIFSTLLQNSYPYITLFGHCVLHFSFDLITSQVICPSIISFTLFTAEFVLIAVVIFKNLFFHF